MRFKLLDSCGWSSWDLFTPEIVDILMQMLNFPHLESNLWHKQMMVLELFYFGLNRKMGTVIACWHKSYEKTVTTSFHRSSSCFQAWMRDKNLNQMCSSVLTFIINSSGNINMEVWGLFSPLKTSLPAFYFWLRFLSFNIHKKKKSLWNSPIHS